MKNSQIKFETLMLRSSLCDYSDAYILVKGTYQSFNKQETTQMMEIKK